MDDSVTGQSRAPALMDPDALPVAPSRPVALAIPNVSEGRDRPTIDALVEATCLPGVRVLDVHSDPDHNRSVLSVAGDPLALQDAMVALAGECMERIDLRRHRGNFQPGHDAFSSAQIRRRDGIRTHDGNEGGFRKVLHLSDCEASRSGGGVDGVSERFRGEYS